MTQSSAPALSGPSTEKIVEKSGRFLRPEKRGARPPRLPRNPPRSHHKFTIKKHPLFAQPPSKKPAKPQKISPPIASHFLSKITSKYRTNRTRLKADKARSRPQSNPR